MCDLLLQLKKELAAKSKELAELKNEFETSTKDHMKEKLMHLDSLKTAEKSYQKLSEDYKLIISRSERSEEKCKSMALTVDSMKAEITALESRCRQYSQTIGKHEQTITALREVGGM